MNKRLLRVAKYLGNNGLYKEAAELKKIAGVAGGGGAERSQGFRKMFDGARERGEKFYAPTTDIMLTEPDDRVVMTPRGGPADSQQLYQLVPSKERQGYDVFNVSPGHINHVGWISISDFEDQIKVFQEAYVSNWIDAEEKLA